MGRFLLHVGSYLETKEKKELKKEETLIPYRITVRAREDLGRFVK
jgi:hypothetical protein